MSKSHALTYNRDILTDRRINAVIGVSFFILAMTLGAYVRIPLIGTPVPITLQTFFVLLSGAVLGKRLGALSQIGYLMLGVAGLPIFQGYAAGFAHLLGPTGGYLIGFVAASFLAGRMSAYANIGIYRTIAYLVAGAFIYLSLGTIWLAYLYHIDIIRAFHMGFLPFIPGDIIKILFAAVIYSRIRERSKSIFSI